MSVPLSLQPLSRAGSATVPPPSRSPAARPSVRAPPALPRGRPGTEGTSSLSAPAVLVVAVAVVVVVVSAVAWAMANYIHVPPGSPEVPKLDVTVQDQEEKRCREGALSLLQHLRPHWDPREVTLQVTPPTPSCLAVPDAAVPALPHPPRPRGLRDAHSPASRGHPVPLDRTWQGQSLPLLGLPRG